jgi:ABC-type multidrug transport system permease subunit
MYGEIKIMITEIGYALAVVLMVLITSFSIFATVQSSLDYRWRNFGLWLVLSIFLSVATLILTLISIG